MSPGYKHVAPLERKASVKDGAVGNSAYRGRGLESRDSAGLAHGTPLECGFWTCRPSIDMSLLWSVRPPLGTAQLETAPTGYGDGAVKDGAYRGEANPPHPPCQGGI